jgi:hypothetical protein
MNESLKYVKSRDSTEKIKNNNQNLTKQDKKLKN